MADGVARLDQNLPHHAIAPACPPGKRAPILAERQAGVTGEFLRGCRAPSLVQIGRRRADQRTLRADPSPDHARVIAGMTEAHGEIDPFLNEVHLAVGEADVTAGHSKP